VYKVVSMTMLLVKPDARGQWRVLDDSDSTPLSEHTTATEAERAAWQHALDRGAGAVRVYDRYGRTHEAIPHHGARFSNK
jgi:hypothetical protein